MIFYDTEYQRIEVKATTYKQAIKAFKDTFGYIPHEIKAHSFKGNEFHISQAQLHEKAMR